jgi:diguanylate cyclase
MSKADTDRDYSSRLAEETVAQMRAHGVPGYPRSYEIWYTHLSGQNQALSRALTEALGPTGSLEEAQIDRIYDLYLSPHRFASHAERTSVGMISEIGTVMEMIDLALGSTARYGESLVALSADLTENVDRSRIREIVANLVLATRETVANNKTLEARLNESKGEIQHLRETLESIRSEALTDALTGLANRKHLDGMLLQSVDQASVGGEALSLLMIDIDRFKSFNDTFGHMTGDQVLRLVSMSLRNSVRPTDTAARFGGEEFAVILPQTPLKLALVVAERVRQAVMSRELVKRSTGESLGRVTVSIGVASFRRGDTAPILLERADRCLNEAKRTGRNRTLTEADVVPDDLAVA